SRVRCARGDAAHPGCRTRRGRGDRPGPRSGPPARRLPRSPAPLASSSRAHRSRVVSEPSLWTRDDSQNLDREESMRPSSRVGLAAGLALGLPCAAPAAAQDTEALRRELEQMRKQMQETQAQYERSIEALSERLRKLEAQPPPVATSPAPPPPTVVQAP